MADRSDLTPEALAAVLAELRGRFASGADPQAVRVYLASRGYDGRRLEQVVRAFLGHDGADGSPAAVSTQAFAWVLAGGAESPMRAPAAHERSRFAPEAWGLLLQRRAAAGWSVAELEQVIERALMHIEGRIEADDLRALLDGAFGGPQGEPIPVH